MSIKSYDSFTSQFNNYTPRWNTGYRPNKDVVGDLANKFANQFGANREAIDIRNQAEKENTRSLLGRGFDFLLTANYASAGFVDGFVKQAKGEAKGDHWIAWRQAGEGLRAGNPFGKGYEEGQRTYGSVLETAGWKPEGLGGKIAKGTVGFVGDVLLDPTTYLSGGTSALVKGTGRSGALAKQADEVAKQIAQREGLDVSKVTSTDLPKQIHEHVMNKHAGTSTNMDLVERLATKKSSEVAQELSRFHQGLNADTARSIVQERARSRGITLSPEDLARDSEKLAGQYNRLMGVRDLDPVGVTLSLANAPFGNKIFGNKLSSGSIQIGTGDTLRRIGDKTFAPHYSRLREAIYGSRIGELFSTTTPAYRLAKEDPAKLYDYVKFMESTQGMHASKMLADKNVQDFAKSMKLTPAENKQMLNLMQDKTIWNKVQKVVKVTESNEAKQVAKQIKAQVAKLQKDIDDVAEMREGIIRSGELQGKKLDHAREATDRLERFYQQKLATLDTGMITSQKQLTDMIDTMREEARHLEASVPTSKNFNPEEIVNLFDWNKKTSSVDMLSEYLFGAKGEISYNTHKGNLEEIMDMIQRGEGKDKILSHVESKKDFFNGRASVIYPQIGQIMGYGSGMKYKSWDEMYTQRLNNLVNQGTLNKAQMQVLAHLEQMNMKRQLLVSQFRKMTDEELQDFQMKFANQKMMDDVQSVNSRLNSSERMLSHEADSGVRRNKFVDEDVSTASRQTGEFNDNSAYSTKLAGLDKQEAQSLILASMFKNDDPLKMVERANRLGKGHIRWVNRVTSEMDGVLEKFFKKEFSQLSDKQKDLLLDMATRNAFKRASGELVGSGLPAKDIKQALVNNAKTAQKARSEVLQRELKKDTQVTIRHEGEVWNATVDSLSRIDGKSIANVTLNDGTLVTGVPLSNILKFRKDKAKMTPEELIANSPTMKDYVKQIDDATKELERMKSLGSKEKGELTKRFESRKERVRTTIQKLEETNETIRNVLAKDPRIGDEALDALVKSKKQYEDILTSEDAFDTFLRSQPDMYKQVSASIDTASIMLDEMTDVSSKVKALTKILRENFQQVAQAEVKAGKLKPEQIEKWFHDYLPHILTPDGARFLGNKKIVEHGARLTKDYGYGLKYNPFANSRTTGDFTVEQVNDFFREKLRGKNLFSENMADIYVTRMLKHNEIMYDHQMTNEMMNVFGDTLRTGAKVKDGYKAVANIAHLRDNVRDFVKHKISSTPGATFSQEDVWKMQQEVLEKLNLPHRILDDMATPMVELNQAQIASIQKYFPGTVKEVNDAIVLKANQARKLQQAKDANRFLQMYDKFLHWTKLMQTTVMPAFHARNKMSNMYLNWLKIGNDAIDPRMQIDVHRVIYNKGKLDTTKHVVEIKNKDGSMSSLSWSEIYDLAKAHKAIDEGFFAKDIGAGSMSTGKLGKVGVPAKYDPTDTANFAWFKAGGEVGNFIENTDRLTHFVSMLRRGASPEEASRSSRQFLFDYSDLTAFEQGVMKRILPYYTWIRKNGRLQLSQFIDNTGKMRDVAKATNAPEGGLNTEDKVDNTYMANFARDWIQTPFTANRNNKEVPVMWNPNLPFMDLTRMPNPMHPVESAKDVFAMTAPQLKVPIEQIMNKHTFFNAPIVNEDDSALTGMGKRAHHMASQLAPYNVAEGVANKSGSNLGLHVLNATVGQKFLGYDEGFFKTQRMDEIKQNKDNFLSQFTDGITSGFKDSVSSAVSVPLGLASKGGEAIMSAIEGERPQEAIEYTGALRPISQATYDKLSDADKKKYTPPTEDEVVAFNKRAQELEQEALNETGAIRKFVWSIFDTMGWGKKEESTIGLVNNVVDGDTFDVQVGNETKRVRMLLVDTPETVHPDKPAEPFGEEASKHAKKSLFDKDVRLIFDQYEFDAYGRTLAYVEVDGQDFGLDQVERGYGEVAYTNDDTYRRTSEYRDAEERAKKDERGMWNQEALKRYLDKLNQR